MDYYSLLKLLHVLLIVIWLGGGFALVLLAARADRTRDNGELIHVVQQIIFMTRIFIPAALGVFVLGTGMVLLNWQFSDLWVIIGLAGFAATFGMGVLALKPCAERVGMLVGKEGISPMAVAQARRLLSLAKFDFVMLFIIVADMVIKPAAENFAVLAAMALALIVAAMIFLGRRT